MKLFVHKHHPCNPWFGFRKTQAIGFVPGDPRRNKYAMWVFLGFWDFVIRYGYGNT